MAYAATLLVFSLFAIGSYFIFFTTPIYEKDKVVKKNEIIEQYEKELKDILKKYNNDNESKVEQKKLFLQKCNSELSRNIFFDESESKKIIQKLASL